MSFPRHTNMSTIRDADPFGGRDCPQHVDSSTGQNRREVASKVVVNRQFLELLADEGSHGQPNAGQVLEGPAGTIVGRLQELLGGEVSQDSRAPIPLAQQVWELTSAQNMGNAQPAIQVAETIQDFFKRVSNPAEDIDEVPDSDGGENSEGESNSEAGNFCVSKPSESMMQRFQDALHSAPKGEDDLCSEHSRGAVFGFSAHLQRVLQREKNQISVFSKSLSFGRACQGISKHMVVKILSRSREAQLTSCGCEVLVAPESWSYNCQELMGRELPRTAHIHVIFNTKDNIDLDLEVGRVVRIDHPWREVTNAEGFWKIIVCTYFSNMV